MQKTLKKDYFWAGGAQISTIGLSLILLPFTLKYLSAEEMGLWYIFIALAGLAQLAEFGFQSAVARHAAYIYAGSTKLLAEGVSKERSSSIDLNLLCDFIAACKYAYKIIAGIAGAILSLSGIAYIYVVHTQFFNTEILSAHILYSVTTAFNLYFNYFNGLLAGRGEQTNANKITIISRVVAVFVSIFLLHCGLGVGGLAIANFFSCVISRYLCNLVFYSEKIAENEYIKKNHGKPHHLVNVLWGSSKKLGLAQIGSFFILKGSFLIVSATLGLATTASYGLTLQIFGLLTSLSSAIFLLQIPNINRLQTLGETGKIKRIYISFTLLSLIFFVLGATFIAFFGEDVLHIIKSHTALIDKKLLIVLTFILLLELHHSLAATYLTTLNITPFLMPSLLSGMAILVLSILFFKIGTPNLGLLLIVQGTVQLIYNNWKWPHEAAKQLGISTNDYIDLTKALIINKRIL